jgi:hypothetical protein
MQTFKSFTEEKAVTLSGGGKTVTLKPGQDVSFKHHETGKTVTGTFKKKKMMGGRQYAHVNMPDNTGMYIPVHHINESVEHVDEGKNNWDKVHRDDMHDTLGNRMLKKKAMPPMGQPPKAKQSEFNANAMQDFLAKGGKITVAKTRKMKEDLDSIYENAQYKADLPGMMKDLKAKKKNSSDMRREYGSSWKKLCNHCSDEHGSSYTRQHLMSMAQKHMEG